METHLWPDQINAEDTPHTDATRGGVLIYFLNDMVEVTRTLAILSDRNYMILFVAVERDEPVLVAFCLLPDSGEACFSAALETISHSARSLQ